MDSTDTEVDLDGIISCELVFRAVDEGGVYGKYESVLAYEDPNTGKAYLVYTPFDAGAGAGTGDGSDDGAEEEADVFASICNLQEVLAAAELQNPASIPKKPPVMSLVPIESPEELELIGRLLDAIEEYED